MPVEAFGVGDFHDAEEELPQRDQLMNVIAGANMNHAEMLERPLPATKIFHANFSENSKFQAPTSRESPSFKHQTSFWQAIGALMFEYSLELGCWCLELLSGASTPPAP